MAEALIGAGGWGYFTGGLEAYSKAFRFVEVNATFYRPIPEAWARRWRASVPDDFVFAVKAPREVSHRDRLRATVQARARFAQTLRVARVLRAPFVVLETPPNVPLEREQVDGLRNLAGMAGRGVRLGLEARAHRGTDLPPAARKAMADLGVLDVVDLSRITPRVRDDTVYSRLFGKGPHNVYEFDDTELKEIDRATGDAAHMVLAFHGVRMYKDAARFLTFKRTGSFPRATPHQGLASFEAALRPDVRFPTTWDDLMRDHGWKVFDLDAATRAHASIVLARLPSRSFESLDEVLDSAVRSEAFPEPSRAPS